MPRFRVGVVGIGDISDVYIENLGKYDLVEVTACAGRDLRKAREKAQKHGIAKAYPNAGELIADPDIDIVLNLTVPAVHAELNLAALVAGKHVYTEKPLAATLDEARSIIDLAETKGLRVGSAPDTFLGGRLQTCRKLIDDGRIGAIVGASAFVVSHGHEWHHPNPGFFYKPGGGPLLDIGPYYMTALLSLMGPVVRCGAMARKSFDRRTIETEPRRGQAIEVEVDTHVSGLMEFESGAIVTVIASFDVWDSELPRIEIYGTKGTICIDDIDPLDGPNLFGGEVLLRTRETARWRGLPRNDAYGEWEKVPIVHRFNELSHRRNSRGIGLVDMAYAIAQGREERAGGKMALHSLEVMEGMLRSARDGNFHRMESRFERPAPLPVDFPDSETFPDAVGP
jgi:predicted dehydrogenase